MAQPSSGRYRFGDLLALARQSWVRQMSAEVAAAGYDDYRRSDAATVRLLGGGPLSIGRLGDALGVTRQAARKIAAGLERRRLVTLHRDPLDARQLNVALTAAGHDYADAVRAVIDNLDRRLTRQVLPDQLTAAAAVLQAILAAEQAHPGWPAPGPRPSPGPTNRRPARTRKDRR